MEKSLKRLSIVLLSVVLMIVGLTFTACGDTEQTVYEPSEEQGEYYYDAGSEEYTLALVLGNTFTLKIGGKELSGSYVKDGELLTLTAGSGEQYSATYYNDAVTLTYESDTYKFLRTTEYTVSFNTDGGSAVAAQKVVNGKKAAKPDDPQKGDLVFVGWYTGSDFSTLFSFNQPITADLTLHARFVEHTPPEFAVTFNANHTGAENIPAQTTVGHKLYTLPTPADWEGHTFVGWWTSDYGSADKLTAQYKDQSIEQPITLYAVWESEAPAVSVTQSGVSWLGRSGNTSYKLTIMGPDDNAIENDLSVDTTNYDYNFAAAAEGDYTVTVKTLDGQTGTAYYKNKALAQVTVFEIEGSTLLFNAVPNATNYLLSVECGSADHDHSAPIDLGNKTSYDFSECDMKAGGIKFTVEATAQGYISSVSEPYYCKRTLNEVSGISFNNADDTVSWQAVENAQSYVLTISAGGEELFNANVGNALTYDLQYYNNGEITVTVMPVAFGWLSPDAATGSYTKARFATPKGLHLSASTLAWDDVDGADGYDVSFNNQTLPATSNSLDLTDYYDESVASYTIKVRAKNVGSVQASLWSADYVVRSGEMGELRYAAGKLTWDAVFGVSEYKVKINEGEPQAVADNTEYTVTFTQSGKNTLFVCAVNKDGTDSAWKSVDVDVYEIKFDSQSGAEIKESLFKAKGDPLELPQTSLLGYTFSGWYTQANGEGEPFEGPTFNDEYDRTVYAKWTANQYKVTFDMGAYGKDSLPEQDVTFGSAYNLPVPESTNSVYAFRGWYDTTEKTRYTNEKGESVSDWTDAKQVTLKASWVAIFKFDEQTDGTQSVSKGDGIQYVTEVTIPETYNGGIVSTVGDFSSCTSLRKISIPNSVTIITLAGDGAAFKGCDSLTDIEIYESSIAADVVYYSVNGVLFYWNSKTDGGRMEIKYYPYARQDTEYTIPSMIETVDGKRPVKAIPDGAFHANDYTDCPLERINVPATVSSIESGAFFKFYYMKTINFLPLQQGETEATSLQIGETAFGDPKTSLSTSQIMSIKFPKRLSSVPSEALRKLTYLAYIDVEAGGTYSSLDGLLCKEGDYGLELVYYPNNRHVGEDGKAYVPETITTSGRATEFTIPETIMAIGEAAAKDTYLTKIVVTPQVRYIGPSAFEGTTSLKEIQFLGDTDDNDLIIATKAFYGKKGTQIGGRNGLKELTLPANLVELGQYAFGGSTGLKVVYVEADGRDPDYKGYQAGAFDAENTGGAGAGSDIETVYIGPNVPALEITDIFGAEVKEVILDLNNPNYLSDSDGILYSTDMTKLIFFPASWNKPYTIPTQITNIPAGMFSKRGLTAITIHAGVKTIGNGAFSECKNLETVTFLPGDGVDLSIGSETFQDCTSLTSITLPDRLKSIGTDAFMNCTNLQEFTLPKNVESLEFSQIYAPAQFMRIWQGCTNLTEINVAPGNTHFISENGVLYSTRAIKEDPDKDEITYVPDTLLYCPEGITGQVTISGYIRSTLAYITGLNNKNITDIHFNDVIPTYDYDAETGETKLSNIISLPVWEWDSGLSSTIPHTPFSSLSNPVIRKVHLPKGLATLDANLFRSCSSLQEINIPSTVTSISANAFRGCSGLKTITFDAPADGEEIVPLRIEDALMATSLSPDSASGVFANMVLTQVTLPSRLAYLGNYAFYNNDQLISVKFENGDSEISIGNSVFSSCGALRTVTLPGAVKAIGDSAFSGCALESIELAEGLQTIGKSAFSDNGGLTGTLNIPASVTSIGDSAFSNTGYTKITTAADNLLASIGASAFSNMKALNEVQFGVTATPLTFGASVFTGDTALTSFEFPQNVKEIGASLLANLTGITSITFADGMSQLEKVGESAFSKTSISSITFPESSAANGIELGATLFKFCTEFTEMNLSASIMALNGVLGGCASIETINIDEENPYLIADEKLPIIYQKDANGEKDSIIMIYGELSGDSKRFQIASGNAIGDRAFANQPQLEYVYIPATVKSIGEYAFQNCVNLKEVEFEAGSTLQSIGTGAFQNCYKLEKINLEVATRLATLGDGKGSYSSNYLLNGDTAYTYSATGIFSGAGRNSDNPLKITFPKTAQLKKLGAYMFMMSGATEIDMSGLTGVEEIPAGGGAGGTLSYLYGFFSQNPNLTSIKLPNSIIYIGKNAFVDCTALEEVDLTNLTNLKYLDASKKTSMPSSASSATFIFARCTALTTVKFPTNLELLGARCFEGSTNLKTITGLDNVTMVGTYAFCGTGLESFDFATQLPKLDVSKFPNSNFMFKDCAKLTTVNFGSLTSAKTLPTNMFNGCSSLQSADLSEFANVTALPENMYTGCAQLTSVTLPSGIKSLGKAAFQDCVLLQSLDLSKYTGITSLPEGVFMGCTAMTTFDFTKITSIGKNAFNGSGLTSVNIHAKITKIDPGAFANCASLQTVTFEDGTGTISLGAGSTSWTTANRALGVFENSAVQNVTLSKRVATVAACAFRNCTSLKEIELVGTTALNTHAFSGSGLTSIKIPATLKTLQAGVFADCASLKTVTFESGSGTISVTAGGTSFTSATRTLGVFEGSAVETVNFSNRINNLPACTFRNCLSLTSIQLGTITTFGTYVFDGCIKLKEADLGLSLATSLGNYMFLGCTSLDKVTLGALIKHLGTYTFQNCTALQKIDLSGTQVTRLSSSATAAGNNNSYVFDGCVNLQTVTTRAGQIQVVGQYAFRNCEKLEGFDFSGVTDFGVGAFQNAGLTGTVTLSKDLLNFRTTSVATPFMGCAKITAFALDGENTAFRVESGALYGADNTLYAMPNASVEEGVVDFNTLNPDVGTDVSMGAYMFGADVKKVILPDGLTEIGASMFEGSLVEEVVVPASVTTIGSNAFANTPNLRTVTFKDPADGEDPQPLTLAAGSTSATGTTGVFFDSAIETLTLPERLVALPTGTFMNTTRLTTLNLPSSVTAIPKYCFYGSATPSLHITEYIISVGDYAYSYTTGLKDLTAEDFGKITYIGQYTFEYSSVETAVVPGTVIGTANTGSNTSTIIYLFRHCQKLRSVIFEDTADGVTRAVTLNQLFEDTPELETVVFGEGINVFATTLWGKPGTTTVKTLRIPDSLTSIGSGSLMNCAFEKFIIGKDSKLSSVDASAFSSWGENQTICFENSRYVVGSLIGFDWMTNTKAKVVFDYVPEE